MSDIPKLVRLDHPILHRRASLVEPNAIQEAWHQKELDILVLAMRHYHGVGLAAPQVGINRQIFVCEVNQNPRYPDAPNIPLQIYINPEITYRSLEEIIMQEGCLSIKGLRGDVPRSAKVTLSGFDRYGSSVKVDAEGFLARIFQHECDHLIGHIFLERIRDFSTVVRYQGSS